MFLERFLIEILFTQVYLSLIKLFSKANIDYLRVLKILCKLGTPKVAFRSTYDQVINTSFLGSATARLTRQIYKS